MSWIQEILKATEDAETPRPYLYWASLATIAAVVSPNVYINRGGYFNLGPNLYIMLIGRSSLGKGLPTAMASKLVTMVDNTRVITGQNTIQAITRTLATTVLDEQTRKAKFDDSRGFIISGEFVNILQEDPKAFSNLTEWYDNEWMGTWTSSTKTAGIDKLNKVCITLLGGSTPEHFKDAIPIASINGGFIGRTLVVMQDKRYKINPLSNTEAQDKIPYNNLAEYLKELAKLKGAMKWGEGSIAEWEPWYGDIRRKEEKIHDPTGAVGRLPNQVLKVAMCLSLSRSPAMEIDRESLEESIAACMELTIDSRRMTEGQGKSALGPGTKLVMDALLHAPKYTLLKSRLLKTHYGHFDNYELGRIIETLENARFLTSALDGMQIRLTVQPHCIKQYEERKKIEEDD